MRRAGLILPIHEHRQHKNIVHWEQDMLPGLLRGEISFLPTWFLQSW